MTDPRPFSDSRAHEVIERQMAVVLDRVAALDGEVKDLRATMQTSVAAGVVQGVKSLADDPKFGELFWAQGFRELSKHAGQAGSQWIGSRILTALVLAVMSACIAWLVKSGKI